MNKVYMIIEHGPNGDEVSGFATTRDRAEGKVKMREEWWRTSVTNKVPPRTWTIKVYQEIEE